MKKRNYILASHGTMAKGIYDAMEIIVGEGKYKSDGIVFTLSAGSNRTDFKYSKSGTKK